MPLSMLGFETDISLELAKHLDLSTTISLSQTCSTLYQLSLTSMSFWIHATDIYRLPVPLSHIIHDKTSAENLRYMALVVSTHTTNLKQLNISEPEATQIELRGQFDGLRRSIGNPLNPRFVGATSMFVQGYKPGSLPWLVTVKGNILRCDFLDGGYDAGVEWKSQAPIDWFWRCDIPYSSGDEYLVVVLTTNIFGGVLVKTSSSGERSTDLYVVKISLPLKEDLESTKNAAERRSPRLPHLQPHKQTPQKQHPNKPFLKVTHVTHLPLPTGFLNHNCRPTCSGSKVFLMLHHSESSSFWAFVYDWEDEMGVSFKLPTEIRRRSNTQRISGWLKIIGLNSMMVFQGWHGPVYAMRIPELHPLSHSPENAWYQLNVEECLPQVMNFEENPTGAEWDPLGALEAAIIISARTTEIICHVFQASETAIYSISRLGSRVCCNLYRLSESEIQGGGTQFSRVAGGFIDIPRDPGGQDTYISFRAGVGARSIAVTSKPWSSKGGSKTSPSFFVIDFDVDCDYDGIDGIRRIIGSNRELRVKSHARNILGKSKDSHLVLEKWNTGEVFFDGFRGTVVVLNKDYKTAHLFSCRRGSK